MRTTTLVDVRVLGPVEVHRAGRVVALAPKQRQLLALLVVGWPDLVSTERLVDDLWERQPPATARKILQKYVFELRSALGAQHIASRPDGYALCGTAVDAVAFVRDVEAALPGDAAFARRPSPPHSPGGAASHSPGSSSPHWSPNAPA